MDELHVHTFTVKEVTAIQVACTMIPDVNIPNDRSDCAHVQMVVNFNHMGAEALFPNIMNMVQFAGVTF